MAVIIFGFSSLLDALLIIETDIKDSMIQSKMNQSKELTASQLLVELKSKRNTQKAQQSQRFFKTGHGQYAAGDIFLGIPVPELRSIAKIYRQLPLLEIKKVLRSKYHEARLLAIFIMVNQFQKASDLGKETLFKMYCSHTRYINNWDIVDSSAHLIVGAYLENRDKEQIYQWARSSDLWQKRIAMIATYTYIKKENFHDALQIAEILLFDSHDLIQKAVGWMLREIGNRNHSIEIVFLDKHYRQMPRTMLRYAIEKFPDPLRKHYLSKK